MEAKISESKEIPRSEAGIWDPFFAGGICQFHKGGWKAHQTFYKSTRLEVVGREIGF